MTKYLIQLADMNPLDLLRRMGKWFVSQGNTLTQYLGYWSIPVAGLQLLLGVFLWQLTRLSSQIVTNAQHHSPDADLCAAVTFHAGLAAVIIVVDCLLLHDVFWGSPRRRERTYNLLDRGGSGCFWVR